MAARARTKLTRKSRSKPKVPVIRNVMEIKGPWREGTMLHFTAAQWKQAVSRIPVGKRLPKQGMFLEAYPIPGEDMIVQPVCVQGPCEICRVRMMPGPRGPIFFDCQCKRDPRCPEDPPGTPPPPTNLCRLVIRRTGFTIGLACESQGCTSPRGCRLTIVRSGFRYIITCACG